MSQTIDAEPVSTTALVRHCSEQQEPRAVTPAQAKTDAIASLTMKAYDRASQLALTPEEIAKLAEDFPDDAFQPGAAGKENLIYIEHAFLRDRLNSVFGPGQWALIPRNRWAEDFTLPPRSNKPATQGSRIYVEAMLMIRGCFVSESVGAMEYYPSNNSQNYGDAVEGAKTAALRRCCKELGIGLQAWKKDWCTSWWDRQRQNRPPFQTRGYTGGNNNSGAGQSQQHQPSRTVDYEKERKSTTEVRHVSPAGQSATVQQRDKMLEELLRVEDQDRILDYARAAAILLPTETLIDWPLRYVPVTVQQMKLLLNAIRDFYDGEDAVKPFVNADPAPEKPNGESAELPLAAKSDESWAAFLIPFGPSKGQPMGVVDKKKLFGFWANFKVSPTYMTGGVEKKKSDRALEADKAFRAALDAAGVSLGFTKPNDGGDK